jgi:hypothetical protein
VPVPPSSAVDRRRCSGQLTPVPQPRRMPASCVPVATRRPFASQM